MPGRVLSQCLLQRSERGWSEDGLPEDVTVSEKGAGPSGHTVRIHVQPVLEAGASKGQSLCFLIVRSRTSAQTSCTWTSGIGPGALQRKGHAVGGDIQGPTRPQTSHVRPLARP